MWKIKGGVWKIHNNIYFNQPNENIKNNIYAMQIRVFKVGHHVADTFFSSVKLHLLYLITTLKLVSVGKEID